MMCQYAETNTQQDDESLKCFPTHSDVVCCHPIAAQLSVKIQVQLYSLTEMVRSLVEFDSRT
jgi:hypothetical protein